MTTHPNPPVPALFVAATRALDGAGIAWCRLRAVDGGAEDDLLVGRGSRGALDATLAEAGFAHVRRLGRGSHRAYHAFDADQGTWWKVDTVTRIDLGRFQELPTSLAPRFLERCTGPAGDAGEADGPTLTADDAFWALLLHELWDRPEPAVRRSAALAALAEDADPYGPGGTFLRPRLPDGTTTIDVIEWARQADADRLVALGRSLRRRPGVGRSARATARRLARWLDRHDPPLIRRGLTVALLGPDGTGKSTLSETLAAGGPLPVRSVYLGLYGGRRGRGSRRSVPGLGFAGRLLRMWRGWLVARWHVARGRIVVFDRHPYDARLPAASPAGRSLGRRLLSRSLPAPDLVVILDAPPEVLYARKSEFAVERLAVQRAGYLALAGQLAGARIVDVDVPAAEVARRVTGLVWERLVDRARQR